MNDELKPFSQMINNAFDNIHLQDMNRAITIYDIWKNVLLKIRSAHNENEGRNISEHSRVIDIKNGTLIVEVDHPGWMELLQLHKKFILKGFSYAQPHTEVKNLAFRLKGDGVYASHPVCNLTTSKVKDDVEEESIEIKNEQLEENPSLPPALDSIFASLREDMLKNSC